MFGACCQNYNFDAFALDSVYNLNLNHNTGYHINNVDSDATFAIVNKRGYLNDTLFISDNGEIDIDCLNLDCRYGSIRDTMLGFVMFPFETIVDLSPPMVEVNCNQISEESYISIFNYLDSESQINENELLWLNYILQDGINLRLDLFKAAIDKYNGEFGLRLLNELTSPRRRVNYLNCHNEEILIHILRNKKVNSQIFDRRFNSEKRKKINVFSEIELASFIQENLNFSTSSIHKKGVYQM